MTTPSGFPLPSRPEMPDDALVRFLSKVPLEHQAWARWMFWRALWWAHRDFRRLHLQRCEVQYWALVRQVQAYQSRMGQLVTEINRLRERG